MLDFVIYCLYIKGLIEVVKESTCSLKILDRKCGNDRGAGEVEILS